ncbi:MAG: hypothetical protein A2Z51_05890 [Deltaproteobacteria bacterium RBG_19FT_COMBO_52_11]|nr:MAG: hypothetical protein A2Z51_05890 [Deltaproteobacteria bacterium RBG_19FT_COMBO_52_11]
MLKQKRTRLLAVAGLWLISSLALYGKAAAEKSTIATPAFEQKDFLQLKVHQVVVDSTTMQPVVFLADPPEERAMPIWIGPCEADAINGEMQGIKPPRPLTHDLLVRIIQKTNGKIQRVVITHRKENIYYATIAVQRESSVLEIDARPSDSIVVALKSRAPLFVLKALFAEAAVPLRGQQALEELYGLTIQDLTPMLAQSFSFNSTLGVLVADVRQGSRAEKDGILRGDIFVELGGQSVKDKMGFQDALARGKTPLPARIFRKGNFLSVLLRFQ